MKSPIIWRELSMRKGKRSLIGDVTKFLDMCQDYYGLTRAMLTGEMLEKNEMEWFTQRSKVEYDEDVKMKAKAYLSYRCRQVCILGAANQTCDVLIMELLQIRQQNREHGMQEIRLFDDHRRVKKLAAMAMDAKYCLGSSGLGCCRVAANLKEALYNVDLVIVMDSFPRRTNESIVMWLKRNRNAMCVLGLALNKHARKHCRVIMGGPSSQPNCYNANVLASFATKLHVRNIVVVTHDLGRETLGFLAKKTGMKLADFHCPPVWGFVGLNKYVDLRNTLVSYEYRVPGPRVSMQIPQGRNEQEIRTVDNMITDANINEIVVAVAERKCAPRLGRQPQLCKITAILDVLRFWGLKQEDGDGEVLSLGVYSDGTFNIPEGLYWSQPVTLEKGFWKPYARFPIPRTEINLQSLFLLGIAALRQTGVKIRKQHDPEPKKSQMRNLKKFNVDNIRKGIKVPTVRTKRECVQALRRLAKEELGIDFDAPVTPSVITEESETTTESVGKDQIFCECWRQELLQLKRMASELSSTTELEVDFSSNLSGSEFSIINPPEPYVEDESLGPCEESVTDSCEGIESSETIVVCDCGEECHCLRSREGEASHVAEPTDQKMVSYIGQDSSYSLINDIGVDGRTRPTKNVTFDPELSPCAGKPQKKFKLYGTKDAIVNEERLEQMRRRVRQYEDRELTGESDDTYRDDATETTSEFEYGSNKFHFSIDGQYEIVGDDAGLEALEEIQKFGLKDSEETFKEMWQDEVSPALQVLSIESETVSTSATRTETDQQTETAEVVSVEKVESERYSTPYLEMIPEDDEGSDNEEVVSAVRKADEGSEPAVIQVP
ncbi:UNVERIFIED_CONTAM: hypothetical protein PYX00_008304 [Menopon gallinae]|uniref:Uncharacterized protein n=1 Tax=Menopon gallinae TaxID=328185 RepID=A0AAW2HMS5_9NEOP